MARYELTILIRSDVEETALGSMVEKVSQAVQAEGGEVNKVEPWGRRRLAYPIHRFTDAYYVHLRLTMEPSGMPGLRQRLATMEEILRSLTVRSAVEKELAALAGEG